MAKNITELLGWIGHPNPQMCELTLKIASFWEKHVSAHLFVIRQTMTDVDESKTASRMSLRGVFHIKAAKSGNALCSLSLFLLTQ